MKDPWAERWRQRNARERSMHCVLWRDSPIVQDYINETYLDSSENLFDWFRKKYATRTAFKRGIDLGCGDGSNTIRFASLVDVMEGCDASETGLEIARRNAADREIRNIVFNRADANMIELPENEYDLFLLLDSLHHFSELEHVLAQANRSLTPEGLLLACDYMGPNRLQWKEREYSIMTAIDEILPDRLRACSIHDFRVRDFVEIIPLESFEPDWPGGDPTEAIRPEDTLRVLGEKLDIIEVRNMGGTILHGLLQGVMHNFDPEERMDTALLKSLCLLEKLMIEQAGLDSYFKIVVARKKG